MRRWKLPLFGLFAALLVVMLPAPGQASMNTTEWTAVKYLNVHRADAGLTKLQANSCLEHAAEAAAKAGLAENKAATYLSVAALTAIKKHCGFEKLQQFGCGCPDPSASTAITGFATNPKTAAKWGVPTHTSIGIARIAGNADRLTIWHVLVGTPAVPVPQPVS